MDTNEPRLDSSAPLPPLPPLTSPSFGSSISPSNSVMPHLKPYNANNAGNSRILFVLGVVFCLLSPVCCLGIIFTFWMFVASVVLMLAGSVLICVGGWHSFRVIDQVSARILGLSHESARMFLAAMILQLVGALAFVSAVVMLVTLIDPQKIRSIGEFYGSGVQVTYSMNMVGVYPVIAYVVFVVTTLVSGVLYLIAFTRFFHTTDQLKCVL